MRVVLSRDEVKEIVKQFYGINSDFYLEISTERSKNPESDTTTTVDSNLFVVSINKGEKKNVAKKLRTKIDYSVYGVKIEEFLKSNEDRVDVDLEGMTPACIWFRYKKAAEIFGFRHNISLYKTPEKLVMSKKEW